MYKMITYPLMTTIAGAAVWNIFWAALFIVAVVICSFAGNDFP